MRPMTCKHAKAKITDARDPEHRQAGKYRFKYFRFRRRECPKCGERFVTYEFTMEQLASISDVLR
ncbi:hypothetical protein [Zavarzinella formosa]|uniref:hypothetical protein n=1 Tax=Zavarzinella formosa TaxID=360055 RepID=UPI00031ACA4B|nr:hypothetical protein [Zavarzinella formosa]